LQQHKIHIGGAMKIRSATFFHEPRSGKESGKETVFSLSAMLAKNKGQPQSKGLSYFIIPYSME